MLTQDDEETSSNSVPEIADLSDDEHGNKISFKLRNQLEYLL